MNSNLRSAHDSFWQRFFDTRTNLIYDIEFTDPAQFPTCEEIAARIPSTGGWRTGMEDCCLDGGWLLDGMIEAHRVTGHQEWATKARHQAALDYAGFRPDDALLDPLWEYATKHQLPVLLHTGTPFISQAPLECTLPRHLDRVAIRFPEVKIIMAHLGHPYEGECIVTARKHPNVYADVSALHYRPWQLYNSLMLVQEYGVWDKILFGSDYPVTTVNASIDGLRALNLMLEGTALPRLDETQIEAMITRDSLSLLGLNAP